MTSRTSLYLGAALRRLLDDRPEGAGLWTRSGLLNTVAARYAEIVRRHCPTLTLAEWCACMDALNGVWMQAQSTEEAGLLTVVWAEVYDADRLDGLGVKWGCDARTLAERIREMDYAATVALVDAVERWWARGDRPGESREESIVAVVGRERIAPAPVTA